MPLTDFLYHTLHLMIQYCFRYLLVVGEGLHGFEQQLRDAPQKPHWDSKGQFLFGEVEHARTGCQLHIQCGWMILHPQRYQLQMDNKRKGPRDMSVDVENAENFDSSQSL